MEISEENLARLAARLQGYFEEKVAHHWQELQKVKEQDSSTGKHTNHTQS